MASWDLEEGGWLWLLPQWQSLEEEMGVVLCKRPHRAYLFSRFLFPSPSPTAWLVWLDESAAKHLFFLLIIKQGFLQELSISLLLLHPGSPGGLEGRETEGFVFLLVGRLIEVLPPWLYTVSMNVKCVGPLGSLSFKDIRRLQHGMVDECLDVSLGGWIHPAIVNYPLALTHSVSVSFVKLSVYLHFPECRTFIFEKHQALNKAIFFVESVWSECNIFTPVMSNSYMTFSVQWWQIYECSVTDWSTEQLVSKFSLVYQIIVFVFSWFMLKLFAKAPTTKRKSSTLLTQHTFLSSVPL